MDNSPLPLPQFATSVEVAVYVGRSERSVSRWCKSGKLIAERKAAGGAETWIIDTVKSADAIKRFRAAAKGADTTADSDSSSNQVQNVSAAPADIHSADTEKLSADNEITAAVNSADNKSGSAVTSKEAADNTADIFNDSADKNNSPAVTQYLPADRDNSSAVTPADINSARMQGRSEGMFAYQLLYMMHQSVLDSHAKLDKKSKRRARATHNTTKKMLAENMAETRQILEENARLKAEAEAAAKKVAAAEMAAAKSRQDADRERRKREEIEQEKQANSWQKLKGFLSRKK